MEIVVKQGRGYVPVEERDKENLELGMIAIDAVYTPVVDVGYHVEFTRVGDITNFEKLLLRIQTDGTITPQNALSQTVKILQNHLQIIENTGGPETAANTPDAAEDTPEAATEAPIEA